MIPLRDDNPTTRTAFITVALIAACAVVFFLVQPSGRTSVRGEQADSDTAFTVEHAAIPCEVMQGRPLRVNELRRTFIGNDSEACTPGDPSPSGFLNKQVYLAMVMSMFMHAGLLHIGGNMLYFWVFGNNVEDRMGPLPFLFFYLVGGLVATAGHVAAFPDSTVPVVGASGAVAAVMGAYLALYPRHHVHSLIFVPPFFMFFRPLRAWLLLGFWFFGQFLIDPNSGVAWVAHVAGFMFGLLVGLVLRATGPRRRHVEPIYA